MLKWQSLRSWTMMRIWQLESDWAYWARDLEVKVFRCLQGWDGAAGPQETILYPACDLRPGRRR